MSFTSGEHPIVLPFMPNASTTKRYLAIKRAIDVVVAFLLFLLLLPGALIVALLLLICDGQPVLYSQWRVGRDGVLFRCYKFRSMSRNSEAELVALLERSPEARREWEESQKLADDPRIHWLGKFLRRSSIDEIPQLWNVLKGEMSLVGPRPITKAELGRYAEYAPCYMAMTPGITGLWQVSGRSNVSYDERVRLDVEYLRTRSTSRDLRILVRTVSVCLLGTGSA